MTLPESSYESQFNSPSSGSRQDLYASDTSSPSIARSAVRLPGIESFSPPPGAQQQWGTRPPGHSFCNPTTRHPTVDPNFSGPLKIPEKPYSVTQPPPPLGQDPSVFDTSCSRATTDAPASTLAGSVQAASIQDHAHARVNGTAGHPSPPHSTYGENHAVAPKLEASAEETYVSKLTFTSSPANPLRFDFSDEQLSALQALYSRSKPEKPTPNEVAELAQQLGVPPNVVHTWFYRHKKGQDRVPGQTPRSFRFNQSQRRILEEAFARDSSLRQRTCIDLARQLGVSELSVSNWYNHQ
ncbi:hypothetical protein C8Q74DRAFT_1216834 [Fomes fomentarius]|nr:hypothetical protein C8Q74DRAFT_1216834 [Fomes fomentarius]